MERLTERAENGCAVYRHPTPEPDGWKENRHAVLERCCQYEETGLIPDQLRELDGLYLEKCQEINLIKRDYVIVCNEHSGYYPGVLLFWGELTPDDAERRSFGGYTSDFDHCERYTLDEIRRSGFNFPVYDGRMTSMSFKKHRDVAIKISQLNELGYVFKRFVVRP